MNIGVLTSGGDSPGMNAGIRAVVRAAIFHGHEVFGVERGYQGLIDGLIHPLTARSVSGIISRGGTFLRAGRSKPFMEEDGRARAAENLRKHDIGGLIVIGGDGSYRGAERLHAEHGIRCIGMPGTIDNDIGGTDYTIGFDTAMNTAMEAIDRLRDTAAAHDRVFFVEVMGRRSGYLSMIAGMAGGAEEVLVPEEPTEIEALVESMRTGKANGKESMIIVVAEGDDEGNAFDIARKVGEASEFTDTRVSVLGHIQRGGSPTAFDRVLATRMGVYAVEALVRGETGKMVGVAANVLVLHPFATAWETKSVFDSDLTRMARIVSI